MLGSAVCMDKAVANTIMDAAGVPHCKWASAIRAELEGDHKTLLDSIEQRLGYPIFVKPANAGSSVGITKATDRAVLEQAVVTALKEDDKVVFEESSTARRSSAPPSATPTTPPPSPPPAPAKFWPVRSSTPTMTSTKTVSLRLSSPLI